MTDLLTKLIDETLKEVNSSLKESKKLKKEAEISAGDSENTTFNIKVSVSNPQSETKLGLRLQLQPKEGFLDQDRKGEIEAAIMKKMNNSLEQFDIQISKDTDVPDPEVMGFFIPLSQLKNMIVKSLGAKTTSEPEDSVLDKEPPARPDNDRPKPTRPKSPLSPDSDVKDDVEEMINEEILNEMLVRELKRISSVVLKEDFYGFINAGNNIIRTLEENGIERPKKYLEYLTKHNIM
jgi:hypothetical protein